jgi:CRISPR/Cas system-associated endoribonuclease Cas2
MSLYVIAYDVRAKNHEYQPLYDQLAKWNAAHLQNSVWLANLNGGATTVKDALKAHMHADDTVCVIELPEPLGDWATSHARKTGNDWLRAH